MYGFESYEQQNISVQKLLPKIKIDTYYFSNNMYRQNKMNCLS